MKKLITAAALGMTLVGGSPVSAHAGAAVDAALALGAFAVFNQLFVAPFLARPYQPVYVTPPAVVYPSPVYAAAPVSAYAAPAYYAPPAPPAIQREVVYPHGRYVLYGDGVRTAYQWVWVPNPPPPPPPDSAPAPRP